MTVRQADADIVDSLVVAHAELINDILDHTDKNESGTAAKVISSAHYLCRVCQVAIDHRQPLLRGLWLTRYLFWVGLAITRSVDPIGALQVAHNC